MASGNSSRWVQPSQPSQESGAVERKGGLLQFMMRMYLEDLESISPEIRLEAADWLRELFNRPG